MSVTIRPARHEDIDKIRPWTTDTFSWGDYVPDRLESWIDDDDSIAVVCTDDDDEPIAVSHALMLSETEGWLEGARVREDYRRAGLGSAMNDFGVNWAKERGANVVRLAIESDNFAPQNQVEALGYRRTSSWLFSMFIVEDANRLDNQPPMKPAHVADVDAAWLSWSASDLSRAGRGLVPLYGWQWRRMTPRILREATEAGHLYQSALGWAVVDKAGEYTLRTSWATVAPDGAPGLIEGLLKLTADMGLPRLMVLLPNLPWVDETFRRAGVEPDEELIYTLPV